MLKTSAGVKPDKTFVLNASTMWLVDHKNKKIIQSAVQGTVLPAAISFLTGGGNLASEFNVAVNTSGKYGKPGMTILELTPKRPSAQYKQLFFVVDPTDSHISESIVIDANGNTNDFHFYSPDLQAPIRAGWFQVNPANLPNYLVVKPTAPTATPTTAKPAAKP
jgi:outer membrane lipoprotein-sorting protein